MIKQKTCTNKIREYMTKFQAEIKDHILDFVE